MVGLDLVVSEPGQLSLHGERRDGGRAASEPRPPGSLLPGTPHTEPLRESWSDLAWV